MPVVSVVMATYNGEKYIEKQLQSIRDQSRHPDEVLIFDDCSTDRTVDIIKEFIRRSGLDWNVHANMQNIGYSHNFYQAIRATSGDYVFLSDQDDNWHSDKIEKMMRLFCAYPEIRALSTSFCIVGKDGMALHSSAEQRSFYNSLMSSRIRPGALKKINITNVIRKNISPGCTMAFDKACRSIYLKNASKQWPHDWELNIFAAMTDSLYIFGDKLIDYRIHDSNAIGLRYTNVDTIANKSQIRLELARRECDRTGIYMSTQCMSIMHAACAESLTTYRRFVLARYAALLEKKFFLWLRIFEYLPTYIRSVGLKGVLGDGMFIIKKG